MRKSFRDSILLFVLAWVVVSCSQVPCIPPKEDSNHVYMRADLYAEFKSQIPDFPKLNSADQKADEKQLQEWQKKRTPEDCKRATSEVVVTLQSFYGLPYGQLTEAQIQKLQPLFDQIRNEGGPYIGQIKKGYSRVRPYEYVKKLEPCVGKEPSMAYPSGHATLAVLYSLVLKDLFPAKEKDLQIRSEQISLDRVMAGVHHPTDIEAGKKLGLLIYNEISKSQAYQSDIQKYKSLLL